MGRILAIDYGRKKIGMAVTDESQLVISSLDQIINDSSLWNSISDILKEYNPDIIILGFPYAYLEQQTNLQKEILTFKNKLASMGSFNIILQDESYTSREAGQIYVKNKGGKKTSPKKYKERKQKIDSLAAHLLLRTYLQFPVE
ncbi:MAG: Holliday junction resolvase RuvX [Spirochaetia bacterium]|nr:Holliday junction resolvase RuvX [Spirochaetia bacterium]